MALTLHELEIDRSVVLGAGEFADRVWNAVANANSSASLVER